MRKRGWVAALALPGAALMAGCGGPGSGASDGEAAGTDDASAPPTRADAPVRTGNAARSANAARTRDATRNEATGAAASDSTQLLADRLMAWQGGRQAWEATRFLRFDWIVERKGETVARRSHAWDRWEGDYRLSFTRDDSARVVALFHLPSLATDSLDARGDVWVGGRKLDGSARDSALERAYGSFVNDSYWLLMPLKWRDPGVHLRYAGRTELPDGETYPTVHLTFDEGLGVTNDQYWGFVDPTSGKMVAWRYKLEGDEQKGPVIWWRGWRTFGPQDLKLALDRRFETGPLRIRFEEVAADTAVPRGVFQPPAE